MIYSASLPHQLNPIQILKETNEFLVVHKPPNVHFHSNPKDGSLGIVTLLRDQLGPECPYRIYPVHRLDSVTSGALLFAKSPEIAGQISKSFRTGSIHKYYVALSGRKPNKKQGTVSGDMAPSRRGSYKLLRSLESPAITRFISKQFTLNDEQLYAFLIKPETGRKHQIRVALKATGAPVLGDARYAAADVANLECRAYLHCAALRFSLNGCLYHVICPPMHGARFLADGFQNIFHNEWFQEKDSLFKWHEDNVWFPDIKLLRSDPRQLQRGFDLST